MGYECAGQAQLGVADGSQSALDRRNNSIPYQDLLIQVEVHWISATISVVEPYRKSV
jgi:hypothetical protein